MLGCRCGSSWATLREDRATRRMRQCIGPIANGLRMNDNELDARTMSSVRAVALCRGPCAVSAGTKISISYSKFRYRKKPITSSVKLKLYYDGHDLNSAPFCGVVYPKWSTAIALGFLAGALLYGYRSYYGFSSNSNYIFSAMLAVFFLALFIFTSIGLPSIWASSRPLVIRSHAQGVTALISKWVYPNGAFVFPDLYKGRVVSLQVCHAIAYDRTARHCVSESLGFDGLESVRHIPEISIQDIQAKLARSCKINSEELARDKVISLGYVAVAWSVGLEYSDFNSKDMRVPVFISFSKDMHVTQKILHDLVSSGVLNESAIRRPFQFSGNHVATDAGRSSGQLLVLVESC